MVFSVQCLTVRSLHAVQHRAITYRSIIAFFLASHAFTWVHEYEPVIWTTVAYIATTKIDTSTLTNGFIMVDM